MPRILGLFNIIFASGHYPRFMESQFTHPVTQRWFSFRYKQISVFIDFQKAFDTVWHDGLFYKSLEYGINGNTYHILRYMYDHSSIQLKFSFGLSQLIYFFNGVKQGCVLSPTLLILFINDLPCIYLCLIKTYVHMQN